MAHIKKKNITSSIAVLEKMNINELDPIEREEIIGHLQEIISEKVHTYLKGQRIKVDFNPNQSTWKLIQKILYVAMEHGKEGQVAQYLVGAKLQLRFPDISVGNESYSTADDQLNRFGDFLIGDTVFHITVAPMPAVFEKCRKNLKQGYRVYLLVPDKKLIGTRQITETNELQNISVESIESFISQNIDELSTFSKDKLIEELKLLLETYNKRVDLIETDKSLMIEIPKNLK